MKFVSTRTRYGGTSAVLCARKSEDATCGLERQHKKKKEVVKIAEGRTDTRRTAFSLSSSSFFARVSSIIDHVSKSAIFVQL